MIALATSALLALAAWSALALAMERHQRDVLGHTLAEPRARLLRVVGWMLLATSPVPIILHWGALTGLSIWSALISLPVLALVPAITVRARSTGAGRPARPARRRADR